MTPDELIRNLDCMFPNKKVLVEFTNDGSFEVYIHMTLLAHIHIILNEIGFAATIVSDQHKPIMDTIFIPKPLTYQLQKTIQVMSQICSYVYLDDFSDISVIDINGVGEYVVSTPMGYNNTFIPALSLTSELPKSLSASYEKYVADLAKTLGPALILYDAAHNKIRIKLQSGKEETISADINGDTNDKVLGELLQGMAYWLKAVVSQ